jgi:hypothetical protein
VVLEKNKLNCNPIIQINQLFNFIKNWGDKKHLNDNIYIPKTHEQWWLYFLMFKCFNKKWDDKNCAWGKI